MNEEVSEAWSLAQIHTAATVTEILLAFITFGLLMKVSAPYGRHQREGWGPVIPARLGWIVMESPAVLLFLWLYSRGAHAREAVPLMFLALWQLHYVHRTFVFPFRMKADGKTIPLVVALLAIGFNTLNAFVNAVWIGHLGSYTTAWFAQPACWIGGLMFLGGLFVNVWADTRLIELRKDSLKRYQIPRGGLFELVSSPNYLGEIVEWIGWAILTWSWAGAAFALYAIANLVPRALTNHLWYQETFDDYPADRRALVPFVL